MKTGRSTALVCIAEFTPKPGMTDQLIETLSQLIPLTKKESGCVRYELHQGVDDKNLITFIDRFADRAAFDHHCNTDYINKYFYDILPGLTDNIKITLYNELIFH